MSRIEALVITKHPSSHNLSLMLQMFPPFVVASSLPLLQRFFPPQTGIRNGLASFFSAAIGNLLTPESARFMIDRGRAFRAVL